MITMWTLLLTACSKEVIVPEYTCPFGVPVLTQTDYNTFQSQELISDKFIDWLLMTGVYCETKELEVDIRL